MLKSGGGNLVMTLYNLSFFVSRSSIHARSSWNSSNMSCIRLRTSSSSPYNWRQVNFGELIGGRESSHDHFFAGSRLSFPKDSIGWALFFSQALAFGPHAWQRQPMHSPHHWQEQVRRTINQAVQNRSYITHENITIHMKKSLLYTGKHENTDE